MKKLNPTLIIIISILGLIIGCGYGYETNQLFYGSIGGMLIGITIGISYCLSQKVNESNI